MSAPVPAGWTAHEFTDRVFEGSVTRTKFQVLTRRRRRRTFGSSSVASTRTSSGYELNSYPNTPPNTSENGHGHKPYMGARVMTVRPCRSTVPRRVPSRVSCRVLRQLSATYLRCVRWVLVAGPSSSGSTRSSRPPTARGSSTPTSSPCLILRTRRSWSRLSSCR